LHIIAEQFERAGFFDAEFWNKLFKLIAGNEPSLGVFNIVREITLGT
jgi:hypothetical protein